MSNLTLWWRKWFAASEYPGMRTIEEQMWQAGRDAGIKEGREWGWREGHADGRRDGYDRGYRAGFDKCGEMLKAKR